MEDKEVGEIWYLCRDGGTDPAVESLIRKLVHERTAKLALTHTNGRCWTNEEWEGAQRLALDNFGIDPKTFHQFAPNKPRK
jgi:hypothetical protein